MNLIGQTPENEIMNTPVPKSTESYTAVSHKWIVDNVMEQLDKNNIKIKQRNFSANENRNQMVAQFSVLPTNGYNIENESTEQDKFSIGQSIYFINSYDKSKRFTIASGGIVFACSNGIITGKDVEAYFRKHTGEAHKDIERMIENAVYNLNNSFENIQRKMEELRMKEVSKRMAGELLGRMYFEEKIISPTQLTKAKNAYFNDDNFGCWGDQNTSGYNFYNNVTEALKGSHPSQYIEKHAKFDNFIDRELLDFRYKDNHETIAA